MVNIAISFKKTAKVRGTTFLTVDKHCKHKTVKRLLFPVITKLDGV